MEFLFEYGLFLAKALTLVIAIIAVVAVVVGIASKQKAGAGNLVFDSISDEFESIKRHSEQMLLSKDELKKLQKSRKKEDKKAEDISKPNLFVIDFIGSSMAKEVDNLRREVTAILCVAKDKDEVLVNVESGGGVVHGYGLAASQLQRIKDADLKLTVSIDKVAASGGYMMACVADKVIAAPFAIVGSIGVIAQLPNFNKVLKKNDIDFEMHTAGEFKRTLTMLGENNDEGRAKFKEEIEGVHELFKHHVKQNRDSLDLSKVATGEYWYGQQALDLSLVDALQTSDDYLLKANEDFALYKLKYESKKTMAQKLGVAATVTIENTVDKLFNVLRLSRFQ
ncbi:protease SohB [Agaribacter marinus]|uniref:Protease SohB n=1 Tax=Agaribacter marinus TaxID=1431249 RepID=A0AA37SUD5_9ALTE|nr:protease SohB [Agaribacter marinus]GLR69613.1 protease SohB [Agaribacter marinus]